jgi:hypothetical protein
MGPVVSGLQRNAVSIPGVLQPWKHGGGPERLLPRRATRSSNHTGHRAAGPSGPDARGSFVVCNPSMSKSFAWHRPWLEVISKHLRLPRQSDRREPLLGGNVGERGPTEADEVEHSLSARRWLTHLIAEDRRLQRETKGGGGVSNR